MRAGTDTGNAFNADLAPNAICLPLQCSNFTEATLEARQDVPSDSPNLLPNPFPEGMFGMSTIAPLDVGTVFTWDELFFPSDTNTPNPFYPTLASCQANAQESSAAADRGDYFSFQIQQMIDVPLPNQTCFIKIQIQDCFASNEVTVRSIDPDSGIIDNTTIVAVERPPDAADDNTVTLRTACLPFVCSDVVQIFVRLNPESGQTNQFCQIVGRSTILNTEIVSNRPDLNDQLILTTDNLITDDYNDPNLGFYFDPGSGDTAFMMAEQRCNAGTGDEMSDVLNPETGVAATFSCFQIPNSTCEVPTTIPPPEMITSTSSSSEVTRATENGATSMPLGTAAVWLSVLGAVAVIVLVSIYHYS